MGARSGETIFPYFRISVVLNVPYKDVLQYSDVLDRGGWDGHPGEWQSATRSIWLRERGSPIARERWAAVL